MRVVSNTSPGSNLAIINRLDLLERRYGEVLIPPEVARELKVLKHADAQNRICAAVSRGWLRVDGTTGLSPLSPSFSLDPGETAAISLALSVQADVLLMDERAGRVAARYFNTDGCGRAWRVTLRKAARLHPERSG